MTRKLNSQQARGLESRRIMYGDRRRPHVRQRELKVDVRRGEVIDDDSGFGVLLALLVDERVQLWDPGIRTN